MRTPVTMTGAGSGTRGGVATDTGIESRLKRVLDAHFDPGWGTAYWLERARELAIDPLREINTFDELALLGTMEPPDLAGRPLTDYIPRRFHDRLSDFIIGQTGGTTGTGVWTAFCTHEFEEAFVDPFVSAAEVLGFPRGVSWLFVGPSGPHVIGKAVRRLAASLESADPFSVDFDPRWARKLPEGSFARERYLKHVLEQAMSVLDSQPIGVLFGTPPVLRAMARAMTAAQRECIRGVHYGGMPVSPALLAEFQTELFPAAVHLAGYGNTLFGCCLELSTQPGRQLEYFPHGDRLVLEVIDPETGSPAAEGTFGSVRFTRLDESMLIVRMRERDVAEPAACPTPAPPGFGRRGVRNPHTPARDVPGAGEGLY